MAVIEAPRPVMDNPLSHENISQRAYEIWEARGRPESDGSEEWNEAVRQIRAELDDAKSHRTSSVNSHSVHAARSSRGPLLRLYDRLRGRG